MVVLIDGYNVLKMIVGSAYSGQRTIDLFIKQLKQYATSKHHSVILIFDGGPSVWLEKYRYDNVLVIYAGKGQTADDYIKEYIAREKHPDNVLLVSTDRALQAYAKKYKIMSLDAADFIEFLREEKEYTSTTKSVIATQKIGITEDQELDRLMHESASMRVPKKEESEQKKYKKTGQKLSKEERKRLKKLKKL